MDDRSTELKRILELSGTTQLEAARALGITKDRLNNYIRGRTKTPNSVIKEAQALYGASTPSEVDLYSSIPFIGSLPAIGVDFAKSTNRSIRVPRIVVSPDRFAFDVVSSDISMVIPGRDTVIVDRSRTPAAGRLVLMGDEKSTVLLERFPTGDARLSGTYLGLVVAILRDMSNGDEPERFTLIWDESGVVV